MPTADTGRVQLRYLEEVTWGVTPASAMQNLRANSESLKPNIGTTVSEELRSDRQISDLVQTGSDAGGDIAFELSHATFDSFLEGALFANWGTPVAMSAATISAAAADDSFNDSANGFVTAGIVVGQWILVAGFTGDTSNNGYYRVLTATAAKITVDGTLVDDAAGETVTIDGTMLRNGIVKKSYSIEKEFADVTQFMLFTGMRVGQLGLEMTPGAILKGSFSFIGKDGVLQQVTGGTGGPAAATTTDVMNSVTNVLNIEEGNDATTDMISNLTVDLTNNLRSLPIIGSLAAGGIGAGRINVTGKLTVYFQDEALYDKFAGAIASSLSWRMEDAAGNAYIFTMPNIKWSDGEIVAGGIDQDVMADMTYQALLDPTTACTLQIDSF